MDELEQKREQNRWKPPQKEVPQKKPESSIPATTIMLMMGTAGAVDAVQALLFFFAIGVVINSFITVFMIFSFYVWFAMHDVSFMTAKRFGAMFGGSAIELIPVLNGIPTWTATVGYIILTTRTLEVIDNLPGGQVLGTVARATIAPNTPNKALQSTQNTAKIISMPPPKTNQKQKVA